LSYLGGAYEDTKQVGIKWNPIYLRRCLDERYENPVNRINALARKQHIGIPQDSGRTDEGSEISPNSRKQVTGQYTVSTMLSIPSKCKKPLQMLVAELDNGETHIFMPVIVKVNAEEQNAIVELDREDYDRLSKASSSYNG
jgi:hypothetical protein